MSDALDETSDGEIYDDYVLNCTIHDLPDILATYTEDEIVSHLLKLHDDGGYDMIQELMWGRSPSISDSIPFYIRVLYDIIIPTYRDWDGGYLIILVETISVDGPLLLPMSLSTRYSLCADIPVTSFIARVLIAIVRDCALRGVSVDLNDKDLRGKFKVTFPDFDTTIKRYNIPDTCLVYPKPDPALTLAYFDEHFHENPRVVPIGTVTGPIHFHIAHGRTIVDSGYFAAVCTIAIALRRYGVPKDLRRLIARLYLEKESRENVQ